MAQSPAVLTPQELRQLAMFVVAVMYASGPSGRPLNTDDLSRDWAEIVAAVQALIATPLP